MEISFIHDVNGLRAMWPNKKQHSNIQLHSVSWTILSVRGGLLILLVYTVIQYGPIPTLNVANKLLLSIHLGEIFLEKISKQITESPSVKDKRKNKINIF